MRYQEASFLSQVHQPSKTIQSFLDSYNSSYKTRTMRTTVHKNEVIAPQLVILWSDQSARATMIITCHTHSVNHFMQQHFKEPLNRSPFSPVPFLDPAGVKSDEDMRRLLAPLGSVGNDMSVTEPSIGDCSNTDIVPQLSIEEQLVHVIEHCGRWR